MYDDDEDDDLFEESDESDDPWVNLQSLDDLSDDDSDGIAGMISGNNFDGEREDGPNDLDLGYFLK